MQIIQPSRTQIVCTRWLYGVRAIVYFQNLSTLLGWPSEVMNIAVFADAAMVIFNKTCFMYKWL